jgi:site-specific DNA recombinase
VRRIFKELAKDYTARDIAEHLNADKIAPPSGLRWNVSTIHGSAQRGNGILLNELYAGEIVWNKVSMVKDPLDRQAVVSSQSSGQAQARVSAPSSHR